MTFDLAYIDQYIKFHTELALSTKDWSSIEIFSERKHIQFVPRGLLSARSNDPYIAMKREIATMSRLNSFIDRMTAQQILLDDVAERIVDIDGPVFELGLGNGRTFDHLREILPGREIFVFDRAVSAHPSSVPDGDHMILGEIRDTLAFCGPRVKSKAALIHCDLGTGDPTADAANSAWLSPMIQDHIAPGGYVLSGMPLDMTGFDAIDLPPQVRPKRYQIYRNLYEPVSRVKTMAA